MIILIIYGVNMWFLLSIYGFRGNPSIKIGTIFLCLTTHLFPFLTDDPRAAIEVQLLCIFRYFVCISIHHRVNSRRLRIQTHHHIIAVIISLFSINAADRSILSGIMDEKWSTRIGCANCLYVDYCSTRHY